MPIFQQGSLNTTALVVPDLSTNRATAKSGFEWCTNERPRRGGHLLVGPCQSARNRCDNE